jgi:hypothetical protein
MDAGLPNAGTLTLIGTLFAGLIASFAWNAKQALAALHHRAELRIIEVLSGSVAESMGRIEDLRGNS